MKRRAGIVPVVALAALPCGAAAQLGTPSPVECRGQRVSEVMVFASAPTVSGTRRVPVIGDIVRTMHVTTDPELTRRYLLLQEGGRCTELQRTESERVLRAQPFIADATVLAYDDGAGGVRVEVHTIDEASLLAGARMTGERPYLGRMRLGNANLMGRGVLVSGEWRHGGVHRDGYALEYEDYQVAGRPWVLSVDARRAPLGGHWSAEMTRPFLTDLQRSAWRVHAGQSSDWVRLHHGEDPTRVREVYRAYADVGALSRIGPPRKMGLLGLSLSHERERVGDPQMVIDDSGLHVDTSGIDVRRYEPHTMTRANLLGGVRLLDFVRVMGFDGLSATQDVPVGLQAGTVLGRSLSQSGTRDDDYLASMDLYAARATETSVTRMQLRGEGRYERGAGWDGVVASGSMAQYVKQGRANTTIVSADYAGVWRPRVPFQLSLGALVGGVRGFGAARVGGAQRVVVRAEQRRVLGRYNGSAEFGMAIFADAGRLWAGEAPLGTTTPWRASAGASLLVAMPVRSARLWRVDLAVPSTGGGIRRWEVRITRTGPYSLTREERSAMDDMRSRAVPASVFLWP